MKSKELVSELSRRLGWTRHEVSGMLEALGSAVGAKLAEGDSVSLSSFGQFEARKKSERVSVNPANGKRYLVPPKLVPVFRPASSMKDLLKGFEDHE